MTTKKALTVVGLLIFLVALGFVIPAPKGNDLSSKERALILKDPDEFAILREDSNRNNNPDWQDMLLIGMSTTTREAASKITVTEEDKVRLADPNNLTASFSKNLYTTSEYAKKNGGLSGAQQTEIIKKLIAEEEQKINYKVFTIEDTLVAGSDNDISRKSYGNALGTIFIKARQYKIGSNDTSIMEAYLVNKDPNILATLKIKKNNIALIIEELRTVPVPRSALPYHLLLINALSQYKTTIENLSTTGSDPLRSSIVFRDYATTMTSLQSALQAMQLYFTLGNISFNQNEPGYLITSVYTSK